MSRSVNRKIIAALLGALVCNGNSGNKSLAMEADWMSNFFNDPLNGFNQGLFNSVNEIKINNVKLNEKDQKWIKNKMVFISCESDKPKSDWHNASLQFLACPEIIEEFNNNNNGFSKNLTDDVNTINKKILDNKKSENQFEQLYFSNKLKFNFKLDNRTSKPDCCADFFKKDYEGSGDFMFYKSIRPYIFNGLDICKKITNLDDKTDSLVRDNEEIEDKLKNIVDPNKGFTVKLDNLNNPKTKTENAPFGVYTLKRYLPTFVAMCDKNSNYSAFYIVYNKNKCIKFVLWADSNNLNVGFQALTFYEFIKVMNEKTCDICSNNNLNNNNINNINNNNNIINNSEHKHNYSKNAKLFIRFSPHSIVEKFYIPDNN